MKILSRRNDPARDDANGDGVVDDRDRSADETGAGQPVATDRDAERTTYRSAATATEGERAREAETVTDGERTAASPAAESEPDDHARRRAAERGAAARAVTGRRPDVDTPTPGTVGETSAATPVTAPTADRALDVDRDGQPGRTVDVDRDGRPDRTVDVDRDGRPDRTVDVDRDGRADGVDVDGDGRPDRPEPYTTKRPRASLLATLGLIVSVAGALFVLSGTLAGYGIGVGAFGAVLAVLGLIATRRRHVAGKTDALIGITVGLAAVVLGIVAMTGQFDWPTADGDWVGRFREWLDSQFADRF
ncbi:thrombospondin [Micromonospora sp. DT31]|uniref:thrombospondin n=1 Tax=Micromonospora sp. DT31 TaxID=3393434 RepID=UPI003CF816A3